MSTENNTKENVKEQVQKELPLLTPDEIEVKVKQVNEKGALALLYKTARTDMDFLDKVYGAMNWQCHYAEIKGNLYCSISIWDESKKTWVEKQDCGIESREDGEGNEKKGEASDAFKRASTKASGCGRELYTAPFIWLKVDTKRNEKGKWELADRFAKFIVTDIGYENRKIVRLVIANQQTGDIVYKYGINNKPDNKAPQKKPVGKPKENPQQEDTTPKEPQVTPKAPENGSVEVTKTLPQEGVIPPHQALFLAFLENHDLSRDKFLVLRQKAIKEGKELPTESLKTLSPDGWVDTLNKMEKLYEEGFYNGD